MAERLYPDLAAFYTGQNVEYGATLSNTRTILMKAIQDKLADLTWDIKKDNIKTGIGEDDRNGNTLMRNSNNVGYDSITNVRPIIPTAPSEDMSVITRSDNLESLIATYVSEHPELFTLRSDMLEPEVDYTLDSTLVDGVMALDLTNSSGLDNFGHGITSDVSREGHNISNSFNDLNGNSRAQRTKQTNGGHRRTDRTSQLTPKPDYELCDHATPTTTTTTQSPEVRLRQRKLEGAPEQTRCTHSAKPKSGGPRGHSTQETTKLKMNIPVDASDNPPQPPKDYPGHRENASKTAHVPSADMKDGVTRPGVVKADPRSEEYKQWMTWRKEMNGRLSAAILLRDEHVQNLVVPSKKQPSSTSMEKVFQKAKTQEKTALQEKTYIMYGIPRVSRLKAR